MNSRFPRKDSWLRFFAFFIIPALCLALANTALVKTDAVSALMFDEAASRSDIDIAFVGSSVVLNNINPQLITEETGRRSFNMTIGNMAMETAYACTKQLFKTNRPSTVVLVIDPDMLLKASEPLDIQPRTMRYLSGPLDKLSYFLDQCTSDGQIVDRLLMFRAFPVDSKADVIKSLTIGRNLQTYRAQLSSPENRAVYMGEGYLRYSITMRKGALFDQLYWPPNDIHPHYQLSARLKRHMLRFQSLCQENGAELIVLLSPTPHPYRLANQADRSAYARTQSFWESHGVPCYNMNWVRPEVLPIEDEHFFDMFHFNGEASDMYSRFISSLLNRRAAGEPVQQDFYASWAQHDHAVDNVANVYMLPPEETAEGLYTVTADSNRGADVVPLYRFCVRDADGSETMLRDYDASGEFTFEKSLALGKTLVAYAQAEGHPEHFAVSFEIEL